MNSFWTNLYDRFKDRRYAAFFLCVLLAFLSSLALCGAVLEKVLREADAEVLLGTAAVLGVLALAWIFLNLRRVLARRCGRARFPPLSSDELRVARSKLLKTQERTGV